MAPIAKGVVQSLHPFGIERPYFLIDPLNTIHNIGPSLTNKSVKVGRIRPNSTEMWRFGQTWHNLGQPLQDFGRLRQDLSELTHPGFGPDRPT